MLVIPHKEAEDCMQQSEILYSLSLISSLFLIENLPRYIEFAHANIPHIATHSALAASLSDVISRVFVVYTEMRNISHAFDAILQYKDLPALSSLYGSSAIQMCLKEQVANILPLQLNDILNRLLPYVVDVQ